MKTTTGSIQHFQPWDFRAGEVLTAAGACGIGGTLPPAFGTISDLTSADISSIGTVSTRARRRPWGLLAGLLTVAAVAVGTHHSEKLGVTAATPPVVKAPAGITVTAEAVGYTSMHRLVQVTGTVSALDELSIGAEAVGLRIDEVLVEERDQVHKGQLLARLDSAVLEAQLQQEEARLQGSLASVAKARQPNRPQDIDGLQSALSQAQATEAQQDANLIQAQATERNDQDNAVRYRQLLRQGFVTVADANNVFTQAARDRALATAAKNQVRAAQASVAQAQSHLQLAQIGGSREDVQIAMANTAEIEGQVRQLQAQIEQTRIVAPDEGLIIKRDAHIGDITGGSRSLFTMVRWNQLEVRAQVPEAEINSLQPGNPVRVSGYGKTVMGRLWQVTPQVDGGTRLGTARITLPPGSGYLPGMFVRGSVDEGGRRVMTAPLAAVQGSAAEHFVYVFDQGTAHRYPVSIGQTSGNRVEITSGLSPGSDVIVEGAAFLNDGDAVTLGR